MSFTKLFSSITESTVWGESHATRIVWITMLAMADRKGRIQASIPGLANRARVTLEECEHAIERFQSPDRYSRTPDNDGRRIKPIDGGFQLLNYEKYREMRDEEARKDYMRDYMQDRRKQEKLTVSQGKPPLAQAEAEAEENNKTTAPPTGGTVWDLATTLLTEQGLSQKSARALLGSWLREWDEAPVEEAVRAAAGKGDIRSYVASILKTKPKKTRLPVGSAAVLAALRVRFGDEVRISADGKEFFHPTLNMHWKLDGEQKVSL